MFFSKLIDCLCDSLVVYGLVIKVVLLLFGVDVDVDDSDFY